VTEAGILVLISTQKWRLSSKKLTSLGSVVVARSYPKGEDEQRCVFPGFLSRSTRGKRNGQTPIYCVIISVLPISSHRKLTCLATTRY
jgi:hypothetical protein